MLKSHFNYLISAIGLSINNRESERIIEALAHKRAGKHRVYALIGDIVSDARFYCVIDTPDFWKLYSADAINRFVDSIEQEIWSDEEALTLHKEEFLNQWLTQHIMPLTAQERERRKRKALISLVDASLLDRSKVPASLRDTVAEFTFGVNDMTDDVPNEHRQSNLPDEIEQLRTDQKLSGRGGDSHHTAFGQYLRHIDPQLLKLAMMIGRSGGMDISPSLFGHGRRSDINGITVGDDLNSLLPIELAMLATEETYDVFVRNYTRKRLQIFSSASQAMQRGKDDKGAIIMCIDTSGSMVGAPEMMAKALAMAIAIIAQRERRPVFVVNYSYNVSFFALTNLRRQCDKFLDFLSLSYSGSNDEDRMFDFVLTQLPRSKRYGSMVKKFDGADLLIISDFVWRSIQQETIDIIDRARIGGMRMYTMEVGFGKFEELAWESIPKNGEWFIRQSEHYFTYYQGRIEQKR